MLAAALAVAPAHAQKPLALELGGFGQFNLFDKNLDMDNTLTVGGRASVHLLWRLWAEGDIQFNSAVAQPQYRDTPRTYLAQGVCQARAGQWGDAERSLSRSFELDPANPVTAFNLAEVLLRRGELERARFYVRRIHGVPAQVTAQSLWLAARIERRLGNVAALQDLGNQLHERFPQSPETLLFERGRFDD